MNFDKKKCGGNMFKKIIKIFFFFCASFTILIAQNNIQNAIPMSVGLYGGLNFNLHSPDFNYNNSMLFNKNATGIGGNLGFKATFPINNNFVIAGNLGFNSIGALLEADNNNLDASINYIELSPDLQIHNVLPLSGTYILAGLETGIPLSPKYSITGDTSIKNETIKNSNFRTAATFGLGYIYEISKGINLTPELTFRIPLSNVSADDNFNTWNVSEIRLSVGLLFSLGEVKEAEPKEEAFLRVNLDEVRYYDNKGDFYPLDKIKVEELKYTEQFPIVPYIFLEKYKIEPPTKYQVLNAKSATGEFSIQNLQADALEINKNLLDIIGKRMEETKNAELTIIGLIDNVEEKGNIDLALQRAEFVKNYLVKYYEVNPQLINIRASDKPAKPSTINDLDGIEENRRIEFYSSNPKILAPIIIQKENQTLADPNLIEFVPSINSSDSIVEWKLSIYQEGTEIRSFNGTTEPGYIAWVIIPNELKKSQIPIECILWVKNSKGLEANAAKTIPVDYYSYSRKKTENLPDKTITKFSLILFDFDSDKINEKDLIIIDNDIVPMINFNSTVKIYGYTDRIGEENYNKELALRRAENIKKYLQSKVKSAKYEVYGVGENEIIFDNDLPLGRQLSRTVQIFIETPK